MSLRRIIVTFASYVGVAIAAMAAPTIAAPVRCPPEITVEQRVTDVPTGLRAFDSEPRHAWTNVQFSDGPPNEQAWLAPDTTRKSGKIFTNLWTLAPGVWLSCAYTATSMIVASRLPDGVKTCEVRYDGSVSPPASIAIDCR